MDLLHALALVGLRPLRQRGEEAAEFHPRGFAQEDRAGGIVRVDECVQERVQVVGRGGEVEPCGVEDFVDVGIERWHRGDRSRWVDKSGAEDTQR